MNTILLIAHEIRAISDKIKLIPCMRGSILFEICLILDKITDVTHKIRLILFAIELILSTIALILATTGLILHTRRSIA